MRFNFGGKILVGLNMWQKYRDEKFSAEILEILRKKLSSWGEWVERSFSVRWLLWSPMSKFTLLFGLR